MGTALRMRKVVVHPEDVDTEARLKDMPRERTEVKTHIGGFTQSHPLEGTRGWRDTSRKQGGVGDRTESTMEPSEEKGDGTGVA